jgi:hypothetical protein
MSVGEGWRNPTQRGLFSRRRKLLRRWGFSAPRRAATEGREGRTPHLAKEEEIAMKASDLVDKLNKLIEIHGDITVVSGVARTGYGELVIDAAYMGAPLVDINEAPTEVIELVFSDESFCVVNGW